MPRLIAGLILAAIALLLVACNGGGNDDASGEVRDAQGGPTAAELPTGSGPTDPPAPPRTIEPAKPRQLYLALGDSLSAGIGASDELSLGWVALVNDALPGWELRSLGVPGDDSRELLLGGPQDRGLRDIADRVIDAEAGNAGAVITLEIGGNDLLDIYFGLVIPGDCPSVTESLERDFCVSALESALATYRANLAETLRRLTEATDAPIFLMTLYNPFSGGASTVDEIGVLALEGLAGTPLPEGLNDVIREVGAEAGVTVVEWYELFLGKQREYIAQDLIHPNDTGHAVMADAVIVAMAQAGLPVVD